MCLRWPYQRLMLSCLCGTGSHRHYQTWRYRHHGQSGISQGEGHPSDHQGCRSKIMVPASILPRPQPNRANPFQDQTLDANGAETNYRRSMAVCRASCWNRFQTRMQQLHQKRRIRFNLNVKESKVKQTFGRKPITSLERSAKFPIPTQLFPWV